MDKGTKKRQICANACKSRKGCVAFDLSPADSSVKDKEDIAKGEMQCHLYGHADVVPASALKGNCYSLLGAQVIEAVEVKEVFFFDRELSISGPKSFF